MADLETKPTDPNPDDEMSDVDAEAISMMEIEARDDMIATLEAERDQLKDQLVRAFADLKNVRRRHEEDRRAMSLYATEDLVRDLLPVLDNFERTLQVLENGASVESITEGVHMVERQLRMALGQRHLYRIESVGQQFDPAFHEALAHDEDSDQRSGTITAEIEAGYRMGDRVIRPARVRVAK